MTDFPKGFVWGTATSAHQVEGNNTANDFWLMEHTEPNMFVEPSGDACDQYHLYEQDVLLLKELGFNAYRFSIEWARIEPEKGEISHAALEHYRRMTTFIRDQGLTPIVTLHHFTVPVWFACEGGFASEDAPAHFANYAGILADVLGGVWGQVCTINEINIPMRFFHDGFLKDQARFAPFLEAAKKRSGSDGFSSYFVGDIEGAAEGMKQSHRLAVEAIRARCPDVPVGLCVSMQDEQAIEGGEALRDAAQARCIDAFLDVTKGDDFVGVQTYSRSVYGPDGKLKVPDDVEKTQVGYEFYPEALEATIRYTAAYTGLPIIVTESGIGTDDDSRRKAYVETALKGVQNCLADGIDVRGYCYWSMLDNYEWMLGYRPTFGLIAVDRVTQTRTVKPSAQWLGGIAKRNAF
jgi:beta-glucosidase